MDRYEEFYPGDPMWSERVEQGSNSTGQGPLGMHMDRIGLNSDLLPGVTTITYRARYISYYVWAASKIIAEDSPETEQAFRGRIYEYDRLLALASVAHEEMGVSDLNHKRIVGSNNARDQFRRADEILNLDFSHIDNSSGGYGSTYGGPIETMGLMSDDDGTQYRTPTKEAEDLIKAFELVVGETSFDELLQQTEVQKNAIESLGEQICLCKVTEPDAPDLEPLRDIYLERGTARSSSKPSQPDKARGRSLELILYLAHLSSEYGVQFTRDSLFDMCYYNGIKAGNSVISVELPGVWESHATYWQVFRAHDYLSHTARALFMAWLAYLQRVGGGTREDFLNELQSEEVMNQLGDLIGIDNLNHETQLNTVVDNLWPNASSSAIVDSHSVNPVAIDHTLSEYAFDKKLRAVCNEVETDTDNKRFRHPENVDWASLYVHWLPLLLAMALRLSNLEANNNEAWDWVKKKGARENEPDDPTPFLFWMFVQENLQQHASLGCFIENFVENYLFRHPQHIWQSRYDSLSEYWFAPADGGILFGMGNEEFIRQHTYRAGGTSNRFGNAESILRDLALLHSEKNELTPAGDEIIEPLIGSESI